VDYVAEHGGDVYSYIENKGLKPLDYSANTNPLGMPENVKKALVENIDNYGFYPDIHCRKLKQAVSVYEDTDPEYFLFGNGAADIIFRLCYALKPKAALLLAPTFSEYEQALLNVECGIEYYNLNKDSNFTVEADILDKIGGKDIVFICNPNNPTGMLTDKELLVKISEKCLNENCYVVIDECFMDFVRGHREHSFIEYLEKFENVIILKAFTKIFAMAGLRLGYCLCCNKETVSKIKKAEQPWSVSVPAQIAGIAALGNRNYLTETVRVIEKEREYLTVNLRKAGFTVFESHANFILFKAGVTDLYDRLYKRGILVRKCGNFRGLDDTYYRIAVKCREDNERLLGAVREVLDNG